MESESFTYEQGLRSIIFHQKPILEKNGWWSFFSSILEKPVKKGLYSIVDNIDYKLIADHVDNIEIFPPPLDVLNAFLLTPLNSLKVVILGQDPYHTKGAAHGLAFSHPDNYKTIQPSLKNIYKELQSCGYNVNEKCGNLTNWAKQGVFLINTALTVQSGKANSHAEYWKPFTEELLKYINVHCKKLVLILWGNPAKSHAHLFGNHHFILSSVHPSPLSAHAGFFGNNHFGQANQKLHEWKLPEIDWNLVPKKLYFGMELLCAPTHHEKEPNKNTFVSIRIIACIPSDKNHEDYTFEDWEIATDNWLAKYSKKAKYLQEVKYVRQFKSAPRDKESLERVIVM